MDIYQHRSLRFVHLVGPWLDRTINDILILLSRYFDGWALRETALVTGKEPPTWSPQKKRCGMVEGTWGDTWIIFGALDYY